MNALLKLAAMIEAATGLALMATPPVVVRLLLGVEVYGAGVPLGRVAGVALLSLGVACWPGPMRAAESRSPALRAMLVYNGLVALYLARLGTVGHLGGVLLWPGVALHALVALLLVWAWRVELRTKATSK